MLSRLPFGRRAPRAVSMMIASCAALLAGAEIALAQAPAPSAAPKAPAAPAKPGAPPATPPWLKKPAAPAAPAKPAAPATPPWLKKPAQPATAAKPATPPGAKPLPPWLKKPAKPATKTAAPGKPATPAKPAVAAVPLAPVAPPPPPAKPAWVDLPCQVHGQQGTCKDIADCTGDHHPTPWHCGGPDSIQCCTKNEEAVAPSAAGEGPDKGAAEKEVGKRAPLVTLEAGGAYRHAFDSQEGSHDQAGVVAEVAYHVLPQFAIAARYEGYFGSWNYLTTQPGTPGPGNAVVATGEHEHKADLSARYDVLWTVDVPVRLEPTVFVGYHGINSTILQSNLVGGGGGLGVVYEPIRRLAIEAGGYAMAGADIGASDTALLGGVKSVYDWNGGISVAPIELLRVRASYIGELLTREHSQRFANGALISLELDLGHSGPRAEGHQAEGHKAEPAAASR